MLAKKFGGKEVYINQIYGIPPYQLRFYINSENSLCSVMSEVRLYRKYLNHELTYRIELKLGDHKLNKDGVNMISLHLISEILEKIGCSEDKLELTVC